MSVIRAAAAGQGAAPSVACINLATVDLGVPFDKLTAALQAWYDKHVLPVWGYPLRLRNLSKRQKPRANEWQFVYLDTADEAGALGYHDLTVNGQPVSKVFVKTTQEDGGLVSVTASHELAEMAIDPVANLWAQNGEGALFAYELCDPVEEDTFNVNGIPMSNFVHPSWFEPFQHPPRTKFDHMGLLTKPFTMTKGGYMIEMANGRVKEIFGSADKAKRFSRENRKGHRTEHRKDTAAPGSGELIAPK
jgi:hypothetical protein